MQQRKASLANRAVGLEAFMVGHGNGWVGNARRSASLVIAFLAAVSAVDAGPPASEAPANRWFYSSHLSACRTSSADAKDLSEPGRVLSSWTSTHLAHDERCFSRAFRQIGIVSTPARSPAVLDLSVPRMLLGSSKDLSSAQIPEVVVEAGLSPLIPAAVPDTPCGIRSVVELFAHPPSAWRELAPLPPVSDTRDCQKANTTIGDDVPEALGTMHWYE